MTSANPPPTLALRYRDEFIAVADKPHGLPAQSTRDRKQAHLFGMLQERFPYVGLHHRLDTPASGLMLFTLDKRANAAIAHAFRAHTIGRSYHAVVAGDPGFDGTWTTPIDGKTATTRFIRRAQAGGMSLIEATLQTGRTHQIRIHAAAAGHPILGDRRHGGAAGRLWPRLALHAWRLQLAHPMTGEALTVTSPTPADLKGLWATLGHQCTPATAAEETCRDPQS